MTEPGVPIPSSPPPARPNLPRYWWLKRILLAVGILILALAALRWWWGHEAERRLQAKIDEYHALRQPVTIEDFQFPEVPDDDNAAHFLTQAASTLVRPPIEDAVVEDLDAGEVPLHADAVRRWVTANAETRRLIREARGKTRTDWDIRFTSPVALMLGGVVPQFQPQRALARFLCKTAHYQHFVGDDVAAVETLRDAVAQGETVSGMHGILLGRLVAMAIEDLTLSTIESIAPTLLVEAEESTGRPGVSPAPRAQVDALIAALLDEQAVRDSWRWAMYGERLSCLDSVNVVAMTPGGPAAMALGAPGLPGPLGRLLKPMFQLDAVFMMEFCTAHAEAGLSRDYQRAKSMAPGFPSFESNVERNSHFLSWQLVPALGSCLRQHFLVLAYRRMGATALAIRLFEIDHGHRPHTLDELVPDYIPAVPLDPFSADGAPIGYRPDADPAVLYSVGDDGVDDGGEFELTGSGNVDWNAKDVVFFLNGDRPRPPPPSPATQPATTQSNWFFLNGPPPLPPPSLTTQPAGAEAVEDEGDEVGRGGRNDHDQSNAEQP